MDGGEIVFMVKKFTYPPRVLEISPASMGLDSYGDSILFHRDWFGEASPGNPMHTIDEGRWAYLPVMEVRLTVCDLLCRVFLV